MMGIHVETYISHYIKKHNGLGLVFSFLFIISGFSQENKVLRLQRAIFIFNVAQQVNSPKLNKVKTFTIGVLGRDGSVMDLQQMAKRRKIYGKPVKIKNFKSIAEIKDVQLLYVNQRFNYEISAILKKISGKQILLVSEDYNYNSSMINMVNVDSSFEYEVNTRRMSQESLTWAPSLTKYAITSSEKWKQLYRSSKKSLEKTKQEKRQQDIVLKGITKQVEKKNQQLGVQQEEIQNKQKEISERNEIIENLYSETQIQQKKYEEKLAIEKELEKNINLQLELIRDQEATLKKSNQEIQDKIAVLKQNEQQIETQKTVLASQAEEIDLQKQINLLLITLAGIILLVSIYIYINYKRNKTLTAKLAASNEAIKAQSLELESKNQDLEQFAYIASHDLQEPLNTISSFIGLIAEDYGDQFDETGRESLIFIQEASKRMKKLIDSLLEYSRLGRTKDFAVVDCNQVLDEIQQDLKVIIEKRKATIKVHSLPKVQGNAIELRLLFQNLISNGMKFMAEGVDPAIVIRSKTPAKNEDQNPGFITFSVKDNGIGIAEEHQQRIFSIFQRLHTRDQYKGTGIGLAHCKKIIESHGGDIWLTSAVGKGSTFYFTIPTLAS